MHLWHILPRANGLWLAAREIKAPPILNNALQPHDLSLTQLRGVSVPVSTYSETVKKAITMAAAPMTSRAPDRMTPEKIQKQFLKKSIRRRRAGRLLTVILPEAQCWLSR